LKLGGFSAPHWVGQKGAASLAPHWPQNFMLEGLSLWQ
jgi:hypothetical protein